MEPGVGVVSLANAGGTTTGLPGSCMAWLAILVSDASEPIVCTDARKDRWTVELALLDRHVRAGRSSLADHASDAFMETGGNGGFVIFFVFFLLLAVILLISEGCSASVDCVPLMSGESS